MTIQINRRILIVEDDETLGENLKEAAEDRGFEAAWAESYEAMEMALEKLGGPPALVILDMNLEAGRNGPEVGKELRARFCNHPPEIIIYSAYDTSRYTDVSYALNAAIYLRKSRHEYRTVIAYARVMLIRHALRQDITRRRELMRRMAREALSTPAALAAILREFMVPHMDACLGLPFMLLVGDGDETRCMNANELVPTSDPAYPALQQHLEQAGSGAILSAEEGGAFWKERDNCETLKTGCYLQLYRGYNLYITLGLFPGKSRMSEDPNLLADLFTTFLRADILDTLLGTAHTIVEIERERWQALEATTQLWHNLGQVHGEVFARAQEANEIQPGAHHILLLKKLGRELAVQGQLLRAAIDDRGVRVYIDAAAMIQALWNDLSDDPASLTITDTAKLHANRAAAQQAFKRILAWFADRLAFSETVQGIQVHIAADVNPGWAKITLRDWSKRLPDAVRRDLFLPYALTGMGEGGHLARRTGLYTARMLLEQVCGGQIKELSHTLGDGAGHLLVVHLPTKLETDGE